MRIQHNIMAMNAYRNYNNNTSALSKNLEKLSSGYKINRAGDDAAGLAISEKMRAQITGLKAASKNVKDGVSLVKTAEGALQEVHDMLNRMDYLATQSANGTYDNEVDRANLQKEVTALKSEIDRIADSANFNGIKLLDGSLGGGATSASGTVFSGSKVAASTAASKTTETIKADLSGKIDATAVTKDYLLIDGKNVTIDWANDPEAKKLAAQLTANHTNTSKEGIEDIAKKLEDVINNAAKAQGVSGSVSVSADTDGKLTIKSNNKGVDSEFSFVGSNAAEANKTKSVMDNIITGGDGKGVASVNKATLKYDGKTNGGTAGESFVMNINGTKVNVQANIAADTEMSAAATTLQTSIRTAVAAYNTANGLTEGVTDDKSGLTGLTAADFTVEVGDNGNFKITYTGKEKVDFSFEDIGDRTSAADLGLANGSSKAGGNTGLNLQIGDTADSFNQMAVSVQDMHANALGIGGIDISSQTSATGAIQSIKDAINTVSSTRGDLGAIQNRLEHTQNNLSVMTENIQDAESTIRDTDVADEMMAYTKNNILIQSAQAMLAQANQVPQGVLQLLQ